MASLYSWTPYIAHTVETLICLYSSVAYDIKLNHQSKIIIHDCSRCYIIFWRLNNSSIDGNNNVGKLLRRLIGVSLLHSLLEWRWDQMAFDKALLGRLSRSYVFVLANAAYYLSLEKLAF